MLIETLRIFCDVADLKSFSKAAEANYVTQSAVSQQIRQLEKFWKSALIERSNRNLQLTGTGAIVYKESKIILERYDFMNRMLGKMANIVSGKVRVATIYSVGLHELQPYVLDFARHYPQAKIDMEYRQNEQIYDEVTNRRVDMGIVAYPTSRLHLEILPFKEDRMVIICHPKHTLSRNKKLPLSAIQGQKFVTFEPEIPTRKAIDQVLKEKNVSVKITMEFDNIETLKRAVVIDAGISIVPFETVRQELEERSLKMIEISGKTFSRPLGILILKGRNLPLAVSKFLDLLLAR